MLSRTMVQQKPLKNLTSSIKLWEKKNVVLCKLMNNKTDLWGKLKSLQHSCNDEMEKSEKGAETIQVLHKDLKISKAAGKSVDNSTFLHSYSFEINTGKLQGVTIGSIVSSIKKARKAYQNTKEKIKENQEKLNYLRQNFQ